MARILKAQGGKLDQKSLCAYVIHDKEFEHRETGMVSCFVYRSTTDKRTVLCGPVFTVLRLESLIEIALERKVTRECEGLPGTTAVET